CIITTSNLSGRRRGESQNTSATPRHSASSSTRGTLSLAPLAVFISVLLPLPADDGDRLCRTAMLAAPPTGVLAHSDGPRCCRLRARQFDERRSGPRAAAASKLSVRCRGVRQLQAVATPLGRSPGLGGTVPPSTEPRPLPADRAHLRLLRSEGIDCAGGAREAKRRRPTGAQRRPPGDQKTQGCAANRRYRRRAEHD